eukprot:CAMPEP_0178986932 /NCGR_PEP_ID=MMETSP0795-20121207/2978_1 /TAXON_ID=88552 /ORGANISM="Amoebophrya sp., Strain Ameob2" /LENGTH=458 /DNA_ID=CAMNT_0020678047 /DNA_START=376 /DNA_END=1752 /DNA_ORIENTATION=+
MNSDESSALRRASPMNALICGVGEYVTGYTPAGGSKSDKSLGVVGLVHFDLRRRGLIGPRIALCGTNGNKFEEIRAHLVSKIDFTNLNGRGDYADEDNHNQLRFDQFPKPGVARDPRAYVEAINSFKPGDVCSVFTPDDTHFDICLAALDRGLHVMVTKPMVKTLAEHRQLVDKAREKNVLLQIEVHKRFDPIYNDARQRVNCQLGDFNFFTSYMSQPKFQLDTFRAWAGLSSDISYYLNSHHIDLHVWMMQGKARCVSVCATASSGVAEEEYFSTEPGRKCEDTITLMAEWESSKEDSTGKRHRGHATYTASWTAAKADVHSQQRFFCLMSNGEVTADQCHRGYTLAGDGTNGLQSLNPLYIRNVPDSEGKYCGQSGYGYVSFEKFVEAAAEINAGKKTAADFDKALPTGRVTLMMTAILEAGRISLDNDGKKVKLEYEDDGTSKVSEDCSGLKLMA